VFRNAAKPAACIDAKALAQSSSLFVIGPGWFAPGGGFGYKNRQQYDAMVILLNVTRDHEIAFRGALAFDDAVQAARFKSPRPTRCEPMSKP
jgi:hypothetical protein